jgi:hypothetical protein
MDPLSPTNYRDATQDNPVLPDAGNDMLPNDGGETISAAPPLELPEFSEVQERGRELVENAMRYLKANPVPAILGGVALGFIIGRVIRPR